MSALPASGTILDAVSLTGEQTSVTSRALNSSQESRDFHSCLVRSLADTRMFGLHRPTVSRWRPSHRGYVNGGNGPGRKSSVGPPARDAVSRGCDARNWPRSPIYCRLPDPAGTGQRPQPVTGNRQCARPGSAPAADGDRAAGRLRRTQ